VDTVNNKPIPTLSAEAWNARYPVGTRVAAFPITRDEPPVMTHTISVAWPLVHGGACVRISGYASAVPLTHVDPIGGAS
jgi:hypothetical protein